MRHKTSGRSQKQELLCSPRLPCEKRRNSPICPGVYYKTSTAPQSRFFRLLIFVPFFPFLFFFSFGLFHSFQNFSVSWEIMKPTCGSDVSGGLAEATVSLTSGATASVCYHTKRSFHPLLKTLNGVPPSSACFFFFPKQCLCFSSDD